MRTIASEAALLKDETRGARHPFQGELNLELRFQTFFFGHINSELYARAERESYSLGRQISR